MMPPNAGGTSLTAQCSYGMVPTRADRCCYVLYSIQSRDRTWKKIILQSGTVQKNILTEPRVRAEVDAAFEKMVDAEVQVQENPW